MPYSSVDELPDAVKKLPVEKQRQWMAVWNSIYNATHDEDRAFAGAWSKVKEEYEMSVKERFEKMLKPMRVTGVAINASLSNNMNLYTPLELEKFAPSLIGKNIYMEHVEAGNAVGKILNAWYDKQQKLVSYIGEIWDQGASDQINLGLLKRVSIAAGYRTMDLAQVAIPHDLNAEHLAIVASPGDDASSIMPLRESAKQRVLEATVEPEEEVSEVKEEVEKPLPSLPVNKAFPMNATYCKPLWLRNKEINARKKEIAESLNRK